MSNIIRIDSFHSGDFHKCSNNGPGFRVVVWFSGCSHNCSGCHNKAEQNPKVGRPFTEEDISFILTELESSNYRGISILGGESLLNLIILLMFLHYVKELKKSFLIKNLSGYGQVQLGISLKNQRTLMLKSFWKLLMYW